MPMLSLNPIPFAFHVSGSGCRQIDASNLGLFAAGGIISILVVYGLKVATRMRESIVFKLSWLSSPQCSSSLVCG